MSAESSGLKSSPGRRAFAKKKKKVYVQKYAEQLWPGFGKGTQTGETKSSSLRWATRGGKPVAPDALVRASALLDAAVELHAAEEGRAGVTSTRIGRRQG